jgi:SAM-dependent methyltransferase
MSHYLEHTLDPKAEVAAAALVLRPGGLFLVEVPDPACFWGRALGRYWLPWFQPQHLHLLSVENLERLLRAHGFEPLVWHRGETHHPLDLFLATSLFLNRVLPKPDRPWLPPAGLSRRLGHKLGWTFGMGLLLVMLILDALLAPVMRRPGGANTFRVLARRGA